MTLPASRYQAMIKRAEIHYARQGFVKWSDLAFELGVSRQRILQMMQQAVCLGHLTEDDLDRYRSEAARRAAARTNEELRRGLSRLKVSVVLTPENLEWLSKTHADAPHGTTVGDLINTAITHYRNNNDV
jgi:hypothetical protein